MELPELLSPLLITFTGDTVSMVSEVYRGTTHNYLLKTMVDEYNKTDGVDRHLKYYNVKSILSHY